MCVMPEGEQLDEQARGARASCEQLALQQAHPCPCFLLSYSATSGSLQVYDLASDGGNALVEINAHKTPLAAMAWSHDGSLLATASSTGTVIRVHALQHGASRLFSFRRGSTAATVHCLAFSPGGVEPRLLAAASSHGSVHVFRLEVAERHPALAAASAAAGLLSAVVKLSVADMVGALCVWFGGGCRRVCVTGAGACCLTPWQDSANA